jgi:hypothetical protein
MWMQACLLLIAQQAPAASIELVESWPSGTALDQAEIPDAWQVWIEMIDGARRTVNLGHFYAVDEGSSRLTKVIEALERAGKRGVKLRFLVEKNFRGVSETTLERLSRIDGLELRRLDSKAAYGGGVMHAKYMLVDGEQCFLGSQNFDWRVSAHRSNACSRPTGRARSIRPRRCLPTRSPSNPRRRFSAAKMCASSRWRARRSASDRLSGTCPAFAKRSGAPSAASMYR